MESCHLCNILLRPRRLCFSPLSSADCSALTRLFLPIISHTSQGWSNYSRLRGYIWFSFVGRGDTDGAARIKARCYSLMLSFAGYTGVWHKRLSFFVTDSALDDFVLMHCVFIPNTQLCPVLMSQYPFSIMFPNFFFMFFTIPVNLKTQSSLVCCSYIVSIFNCCAATMPRPRRDLNRRSWTTRLITSAGWSGWWCTGLP